MIHISYCHNYSRLAKLSHALISIVDTLLEYKPGIEYYFKMLWEVSSNSKQCIDPYARQVQ